MSVATFLGGGSLLGAIGAFVRVGRLLEQLDQLKNVVATLKEDLELSDDQTRQYHLRQAGGCREHEKQLERQLVERLTVTVQPLQESASVAHRRVDELSRNLNKLLRDQEVLAEGLRHRLEGLERAESGLTESLRGVDTLRDRSATLEKRVDRIEDKQNDQAVKQGAAEARLLNLEKKP